MDPRTLIPVYIHGDGGRTYKHDELMIFQFQPCMGHGTMHSRPVKPNSIGVSLKGHSFTTRFLFGVLQKAIYSNDPSTFERFLEHMALDLQSLYHVGVKHERTGVVFKFCVIGVKGDLPFLAKAGNMNRTFLHIRKRPVGPSSKPLTGCCFLCLAGSEQPDGSIPFEDFSDNPRWLRTTGQGNPLPWERYPPFLQFLPHSPEDPPSFFKLDVLHLYHLGVGRDFGASSLVYLMTLYEAESIPKAIEKLNSDFKSFLLSSKKVVHFKQITKDLLGYISSKAYPVGHWNKAMDTPVVVQFAEWLVEKFGGESTPDLLIRSGCKAIGVCMRTMLSSALWLDRSEAKIVGDAALHFAQCYGKLVHYFSRKVSACTIWCQNYIFGTISH